MKAFVPIPQLRSPARAGLALFALAVVLALPAACAEKKPLLPDPDQAGNYTGDAGDPAPAATSANTADGATP